MAIKFVIYNEFLCNKIEAKQVMWCREPLLVILTSGPISVQFLKKYYFLVLELNATKRQNTVFIKLEQQHNNNFLSVLKARSLTLRFRNMSPDAPSQNEN